MSEQSDTEGLRERLTRQGEDAIGKLAQDLLENPLVHGALARAFEAREKAAQAQEVAMGALNIPSATDIERLTRRIRSVSQRLEGIEDGVDRLDERLGALAGSTEIEARLAAIEQQLGAIADRLATTVKGPAAKPAAARTASAKPAAKRSTGGAKARKA
jgi:hypothetical protein